MQQLKLSQWLKGVTIFVGIIGGLFFFLFVPTYGRNMLTLYPEFSSLFYLYLIMTWIGAIPCYLALFQFWKVCIQIGKDNSFSHENAKSLQNIGRLALIDTAYCLIGILVLLLANSLHIFLFIAALFIIAAGIAIAVIAAVLSHLIEKAWQLKQENDLTI